jgi:hypothetical protein
LRRLLNTIFAIELTIYAFALAFSDKPDALVRMVGFLSLIAWAIWLVAVDPVRVTAETIDVSKPTVDEMRCQSCGRLWTDRQGAYECRDPRHRSLAEVR